LNGKCGYLILNCSTWITMFSFTSVCYCAFARFAAPYLAGLNLTLPQQTNGKERLLNVSGFITRAYLLSLSWSLPYMYLTEILASNCVCICLGGKLRLVMEISINWDSIIWKASCIWKTMICMMFKSSNELFPFYGIYSFMMMSYHEILLCKRKSQKVSCLKVSNALNEGFGTYNPKLSIFGTYVPKQSYI
jgi:hypothetical protein